MSKTAETDAPAGRRTLTAVQRKVVNSLRDTNPEDIAGALTFRPTDVYASPERFALERARLFRGRPVPLELSCALPDRRTHVVNDDHGVSVILTRDDAGRAHAFANVCTHRCSRLSTHKEPRGGALITCPYHNWSFSLTGDLVAVPREDVFPGLDKKALGLVRLECEEAGGLIWVNLDPAVKADFAGAIGGLADDFDAIGLGAQVIYRRKRVDLPANWKLVHDAFLENYHVARLHARSLGTMFADRQTVCFEIGPHLLQSSGRIGYKQSERQEIDTFAAFRDMGVFSYTILPGGILITSPTYINVMLMAPQAPDRTVLHYYMLVDRMPETDEERSRCERSIALMEKVTTDEDFWVAQLGTLGAAEGHVKRMALGGMEQDIAWFHRKLEAELGL